MAYLSRWRIEETIRYTEHGCALEDIRAMACTRPRNMVALVTAAKPISGVPDFGYCALADGIGEICARFPRRAMLVESTSDPPQLILALA